MSLKTYLQSLSPSLYNSIGNETANCITSIFPHCIVLYALLTVLQKLYKIIQATKSHFPRNRVTNRTKKREKVNIEIHVRKLIHIIHRIHQNILLYLE